jgi:tryptophan 2,3-dioxygenase
MPLVMTKAPRVTREEELTYNRYLKVPELLSLQVPQTDPAHHDEMLFIIIHQAYELWFKLVLHELENAIRYMNEGRVLRARHFVERVVEIFRLLVPQIHVLETMTPAEFLGFRHALNPASGFQSVQFREVEFAAGLQDEKYLRFFKNDPEGQARLQARLDAPTLRDAYYALLRRLGAEIPEGPWSEADEEKVLDALLPIYQNPEEMLPRYLLTESLIDLDEYLGLWREHHVRVVERIIGHKPGTGGSSGVGYLKSTTGKKAFPLLWRVRTRIDV